MSGTFLQRVEWYSADSPTIQVPSLSPLNDIKSFTARKGTDVKNNILTVRLKNPHRRYVTGDGLIRFKEEDVIKIYAKLTSLASDIGGTWHSQDNLLGVYFVEELSQISTLDKHEIQLTCVDRAYIIFNKVFTKTYGVVSSDYWTAPGILRDVTRLNTFSENEIDYVGSDFDGGVRFAIDAKFVSEGGLITDYREEINTTLSSSINAADTTITLANGSGFQGTSGTIVLNSEHIFYSTRTGNTLTGCIRGIDNTVPAAHTAGATVYQGFPLIDMTKIWKPLYEWFQELGTTQNTNYAGEDFESGNQPFYNRSFLLWIDANNKLNWLPADDTVDTDLVVGEDELYEVALEKSVFDSVNMVIYNVGEDMYGAGTIWYYYNEQTEVRQLKMRYQPMIDTIESILNDEYRINSAKYPTAGTGSSNRRFPTVYDFTPSFFTDANLWQVNVRRGSALTAPSNDSEFNTQLKYAAMWRGRNKAIAITSLLSGLRYKGRITMRGTLINPGDLIQVTDRNTGLLKQLVRVIDVTHNGNPSQFSTTVDVEEDEETIRV